MVAEIDLEDAQPATSGRGKRANIEQVEPVARAMIEQYLSRQEELQQAGRVYLGMPLLKFLQRAGLERPKNANTWRLGFVRQLKSLNLEHNIEVGISGASKDNGFAPNEKTYILWRVTDKED